jgi:two-component system CheB/CheR fusion protein
MSTVERQVQDRQGCWFSLRIRPYKSLDNRIDGAVLSLFDIDALRRQELELRETRHYAEAVVQAIQQPLIVLDADLRIRTVNPPFLTAFRLTEREVIGRTLSELDGGGWNTPGFVTAVRSVDSGRHLDRVEFDHDFPRVGRRHVAAHIQRIEGPAGRPAFIVLTLDDRWPGDAAGGHDA